MEALAFTLINRSKETFVPEETEFRPFDLQVLRHLYNAKDVSPIRPTEGKKSFVSQAS